ncbi:zinc knuckle CX2CX4HX4C containing protein [Tanacetum coccineum]|uniref:Zinc knuckle CX2CX4HX4C containing protein n=1 Tax=Tanacetum coccineum TaxID=301880 RepID=A0ABQ5BQC6_9ASTR
MEGAVNNAKPLRSCLRVTQVRDIDGKVLGKDGKPMMPIRGKERKKDDGAAIPQKEIDSSSIFGGDDKEINETVMTNVVGTDEVHNRSVKGNGVFVQANGAATSNVKTNNTPYFVNVLQGNPNKKVVKIQELRNSEVVDGAAVAILIEAVEEVSSRFANTLYGYFIGKRLAFPLVENYVKNTWAKYGLRRIQLHEDFFMFQFDTKEGMESVMENGPWLIHFFWKRIFKKRTKRKPKTNKTEHGMEKYEKTKSNRSQSHSKSKSQQKSQPQQSQSQPREAESEEYKLEGPKLTNPKVVNQG